MRALLLLALFPVGAVAHVGNPDVYFDGKAGRYQLFVTVRPPLVIPGVAEIEVRSATADVQELRVVPLALNGAGSQYAPIADKLIVSPQDPQFFTGSVWMMTHGSWQVRVTANGTRGAGVLAVPLPSVARSVKKMQFGMGALLGVLGLALVGGFVAMTGSGIREARLEPGVEIGAMDRRRGRIGAAVATVAVAGVVWGGATWWNHDATAYASQVYQPLEMKAALAGDVMTLKLREPGWMQPPAQGMVSRILFVRRMDDLVPDHNHLMHLYAIRQPGLDVVYHLHPALVETGLFRLTLPDMPAGDYRLYGDIVHEDGFAETMVTSVHLPDVAGSRLSGDDAKGTAAPWTNASESTTFALPDGYRMEWFGGSTTLRARQASLFRFRLLAPDGKGPRDMAFYMGMLGHAAFVKTDGSAFAHIHPNGSPAMAAVMLTEGMGGMDRSDEKQDGGLPNEVSFPYGFPASGRYRIVVQMKHGETVETGIFDAAVE